MVSVMARNLYGSIGVRRGVVYHVLAGPGPLYENRLDAVTAINVMSGTSAGFLFAKSCAYQASRVI